MINHSRRDFLKASIVGAISVSIPLTLSSSKLIREEAIDYSYSFGQKALSYSFSTQELLSTYLAVGGIWIAELLLALMMFVTLICSVIAAAILV